jgi:hypothetical protein
MEKEIKVGDEVIVPSYSVFEGKVYTIKEVTPTYVTFYDCIYKCRPSEVVKLTDLTKALF